MTRLPGLSFPAIIFLILALSVSAFARVAAADNRESPLPRVKITTSEGIIELQLRPDIAPATVDSFLAYVEEGFYDGTVFHRVINGFMIQGGGFDSSFHQKQTHDPVVNESRQTAPNLRGTIAMARTAHPDSATAQFFINLIDNPHLNATASRPGYTVFGKVVSGMGVVDAIAQTPTASRHGMGDVPRKEVVIESARRIHPAP